MRYPIAIVAAMVALCALVSIPGREARAQSGPQSLPSTAPGEAPSPPPATPTPNRKSHSAAAGGTVIRGSDIVSLIATLPWWRIDESRLPDPARLESPILTASDLWLGFPFATGDAQSLTVRLAAAQQASEIELAADRVKVTDADELNEIDMAAPPAPQGTSHPWLSALLALFGGVVAAFSAVRYLFA